MTKIVLVDINPNLVSAWHGDFKDHPEVGPICGDITKQNVDVWVTPTNSKGHMSGGVDAAIRNKLGPEIQVRIQDAIGKLYEGLLPVGKAVIVEAPTHSHEFPRYVVATPSMVGESDNLKRTKNTALACAAAFQAIYYAAEKKGAEIESIAIPGLGSGTGQVPVDVCSDLMLVGYRLFRRKRYEDFDEMLEHLNEELGKVGLAEAAKVGPQPGTGKVMQTVEGGVEKGTLPEYDPEVPGMVGMIPAGTVYGVSEPKDVPKEGIKVKPSAFHGDPVEDTVASNEEKMAPELTEGQKYIQGMPIGTPII